MEYIEIAFTLDPVEPAREVLMAYLAEGGYDSFVDTENGMKAYVPKPDWDKDFLQETIKSIGFAEVKHSVNEIADQNWNATWESQFQPIDVDGKCFIRAPFHEASSSSEYEIVIQPQMSFGTGHHATTYQMVKAMLTMDLKDKAVLDMGAGTAILSVLAEKMKARSIDAIDIEEWAFNNAKENALLNNCSRIKALLGDAELLPKDQVYDIVLANINRNILLEDMSSYVRCMKKDAYILFSGFFPSDNELITLKAHELGLSSIHVQEHDGWSQLTFQKQ